MLDQPIVSRVFGLTYLGWTLIHFFAQIGTPSGCELYIDPDTLLQRGVGSHMVARSTCMSSNLSVQKVTHSTDGGGLSVKVITGKRASHNEIRFRSGIRRKLITCTEHPVLHQQLAMILLKPRWPSGGPREFR